MESSQSNDSTKKDDAFEKLNKYSKEQSKKKNLGQIGEQDSIRKIVKDGNEKYFDSFGEINENIDTTIADRNTEDVKLNTPKIFSAHTHTQGGQVTQKYDINNPLIFDFGNHIGGKLISNENSSNTSEKSNFQNSNLIDYLSNYNLSNPEVDELITREDLDNYTSHLLNSQLLILESPYEKASILIIDGILKDKQLKGFNIKSFDKTKFLSELEGDQFQFITRSIVTFDHPTILLIDISIDEYTKIMEDDFLSYEQTKERLRERKLYIIINYRQGNNHVIDTLEKPEFYFQVPFLAFFLARKFKIESKKIPLIVDTIIAQRALYLWDSPLNDYEFYLKLCECKSSNILLNKIKNLENEGKEVQKIDIENLVNSKDSVLKTVLFIATYFPYIKLRDFRILIDFYNVCKDNEAEKIRPHFKQKLNNKKKEKRKAHYSYQKEWKFEYNRIFKESYLITRTNTRNEEIIDFEKTYLGDELRNYFNTKEPIYVQINFEYLLNSSFFLKYEGSPTLIRGFVKLLAFMAAKDPHYYGATILVDIIMRYLEKAYSEPDSKISENEDLRLATLSRELNRYIILLADIIHEMLQYEYLHEMIESLFNLLIQKKRADIILLIINEISNRTDYTENFDIYHWLKEVILYGENEEKNSAYNLLLKMSIYNSKDIYITLGHVIGWNQNYDRNNDNELTLYEYCSYYIFDLTLNAIKKMDINTYGHYPSPFLMFKPLVGDNLKDKLNQFTQLLFDSKLGDIVAKNLYNAKNDSSLSTQEPNKMSFYLIGQISTYIEELYLMLMNTEDGKPIHPNNKNTAELLIQCIIENTSRNQQINLKKFWKGKIDFYLRKAPQLYIAGELKQRKKILKRRRHLVQLLKLFIKYSKENLKTKLS